MEPPVIATPRLLLRSLTPADAGALFAYRSDPEVFRYQSWRPQVLREAADFIVRYTQDFGREDSWFQLGIFHRETGELVGDLGFHFGGRDDSEVELGFTIARAHQRQGYASEAVREVMAYLFREQGKSRLVASVDPDNTASRALLERIGWRQEAFIPRSILIDGRWCDDLRYTIEAPTSGSCL